MAQALTSVSFRRGPSRALDYLLSPESRLSRERYLSTFRYRTPILSTYSTKSHKEKLELIRGMVLALTNQSRYTGRNTREAHGTLTPRQTSILLAIYMYQGEQGASYDRIPSGPTRNTIETLTGFSHNPQMTRDLKTLETLKLIHRVKVTPLTTLSQTRSKKSRNPPPGGTEVRYPDRKPRRHTEYRLSARSRVWARPATNPVLGGEGIHRNPSRRNYMETPPILDAYKSL